MMIIAPTLFSARRRGLRGKKRREDKEMKDQQELRHQERTLPQVQLCQGCRMRGTGENMNGGVGLYYTEGAAGARDQSCPLTIGMEGATER